MAEKIDWNKVVEWDKKYRPHVEATNAEYVPISIEHTEGDYLVTPDGTRLLDCLNQLICVNAGQCHPKIQEAIREATNWNRGMELPMQTFGGYEYAKEYDIER